MKVSHGKRKLAQVNNEVSKRLAAILNVPQSDLESTDNSNEVDSEQDMNQKANDSDKLVELIKEKLKVIKQERKNINFNPDTRILVLTKNSKTIQDF